MPQYYPNTTNLVTHSYADGHGLEFNAEFDDALLDQTPWKNPRYEGSKLIAKEINKFTPTNLQIDTPNTASSDYLGQYVEVESGDDLREIVYGGDISFQNLPVLNNHSVALYIANTVVGGTEDPQYVTLKNHSYVTIEKILVIAAP